MYAENADKSKPKKQNTINIITNVTNKKGIDPIEKSVTNTLDIEIPDESSSTIIPIYFYYNINKDSIFNIVDSNKQAKSIIKISLNNIDLIPLNKTNGDLVQYKLPELADLSFLADEKADIKLIVDIDQQSFPQEYRLLKQSPDKIRHCLLEKEELKIQCNHKKCKNIKLTMNVNEDTLSNSLIPAKGKMLTHRIVADNTQILLSLVTLSPDLSPELQALIKNDKSCTEKYQALLNTPKE